MIEKDLSKLSVPALEEELGRVNDPSTRARRISNEAAYDADMKALDAYADRINIEIQSREKLAGSE